MNRDQILEELRCIMKRGQFYVYCISDPDTLIPFYIGKGKDYRILRHSIYTSDSGTNLRLSNKLKSLKNKNKEVDFKILAASSNEDAIYHLESYYIAKYGLKSIGGTLLNFSYGGKHNEYLDYYGEEVQKSLRKQKGEHDFGTPVYIQGFIYPSLRRAISVTKVRGSQTGLAKSLKNDKIHNSCFLMDSEEDIKHFDDKMRKLEELYWQEQVENVLSYNREHPDKPINVDSYRKCNPRYAYLKRLEEDHFNITHGKAKIYVDYLPFYSFKYAGQYLEVTPSYVKTLINKGLPGYYLL